VEVKEMSKDARTTANELGDFVNTFTPDESGFIEGMSHQHRTLQQSITRMFLVWLRYLATLPENRYDARNEASVRFAKSVILNVPEQDMYLPYI
jgi:hypothetical protein